MSQQLADELVQGWRCDVTLLIVDHSFVVGNSTHALAISNRQMTGLMADVRA